MKKGEKRKHPASMYSWIVVTFIFLGLLYLSFQIKRAHGEYLHWKSRETVLIKELETLRKETTEHQLFLERLRRNPDFQDEVARKELGYGKPDEWLYRFPQKQKVQSE